MVFQSNWISLKNTFNVPNNMPKPNTKTDVTINKGIKNIKLISSWYPRKNMMIKNGIKTNKRLIIAATIADKGKLNGCKFIDLSIEELSIKEVKTCKIEAEIKFQNTKPLKAYKAKFSIWLILLKTIIKIKRNNNGFNMLQKIPKTEFLYLSLIVFRAMLRTALIKPLSNLNVAKLLIFCKNKIKIWLYQIKTEGLKIVFF